MAFLSVDLLTAKLVNETCLALAIAEIEDVIDLEIAPRLFGTGRLMTSDGCICRLTPFGELALRDVVDIARRSGWSEAMKRRAIGDALTFAVFERKDTTA
jgi:hypothetical protein